MICGSLIVPYNVGRCPYVYISSLELRRRVSMFDCRNEFRDDNGDAPTRDAPIV